MLLKTEWTKQGFIDEPVAEGTDLKAEIRKLCKEKGAIILAHYYTLSANDQGKDWLPFNSMLKLLRKFDGLRIYKLD